MAEHFDQLNDKLGDFIKKQKIYFVATAPNEAGHINLSPKGLDSLHIINNKQVAWLNLTGSGNETAAHVIENGRMTMMFCSFERQPLILRLYGGAEVIYPRHDDWKTLYQNFEPSVSARQIFRLDIEQVQTSCGFAVPFYDFVAERETLLKSANKRGESGIRDYWEEKNQVSLDGLPTGIFE